MNWLILTKVTIDNKSTLRNRFSYPEKKEKGGTKKLPWGGSRSLQSKLLASIRPLAGKSKTDNQDLPGSMKREVRDKYDKLRKGMVGVREYRRSLSIENSITG